MGFKNSLFKRPYIYHPDDVSNISQTAFPSLDFHHLFKVLNSLLGVSTIFSQSVVELVGFFRSATSLHRQMSYKLGLGQRNGGNIHLHCERRVVLLNMLNTCQERHHVCFSPNSHHLNYMLKFATYFVAESEKTKVKSLR